MASLLLVKILLEAAKVQDMYDNGEIDKYEKMDLEQELRDVYEEESMNGVD